MKSKLFYPLIILCFFASLNTLAQETDISGVVYDDETSTPLAGANIYIKGTSKGTVSKTDGSFTIKINQGDILVFSFIGFESQEVKVENQQQLSIKMVASLLSEIVIIGSRSSEPRSKLETLAPVDVVDMPALTKTVPQVEINSMLHYQVPSFNSNRQSIADGTDHIDPASMRGLGPD